RLSAKSTGPDAEVPKKNSEAAGDDRTVLFLVDQSLSVPGDYDPQAAPDSKEAQIDHRWERIKKFIREAVKNCGEHEHARAGVICFGRNARLVVPPSTSPRLDFLVGDHDIDPTRSDIAKALQLALASFPEKGSKRIVLISDGNENLGNAEEQ